MKGELTKEEEDKLFENQTHSGILTLFMLEIKKLIDTLKLENIVESHKAVNDILQVEPTLSKVEKRLVSN